MKKYSKDFKFILKAFLIFLAALSVIGAILSFVLSFSTDIPKYIFVIVVVFSTISLFGIIDLIVAKFNLINKWIGKRASNYYDKIYAKEISALQKYFN